MAHTGICKAGSITRLVIVVLACDMATMTEAAATPPSLPSPRMQAMPRAQAISHTQTMPRDAEARRDFARPVATAAISGRVVDSSTGRPVARVFVTLVAHGSSIVIAAARTDEGGRFAFADLPAGRFSVRVRKAGFLSGEYPDVDASVKERDGLTLATGQRVDVSVPIARAAVISGRVVDESGDPVDGASVALFAPSGRASAPGAHGPLSNALTNDAGEFRLAGLSEGRYILTVTDESVGDVDGWPRGGGAATKAGYPTTYYPGVASRDQAGLLSVARGQQLSGLDIALPPLVRTLVTGTVTSASGAALAGHGVLFVPLRANGEENVFEDPTSASGEGAEFRVRLPPGEYELLAKSTSFGSHLPEPSRPEFARTRVSVGTEPILVDITISPGATIHGRVVFDGTSPLPRPGEGRPWVFRSARGRRGDCQIGGLDTRPDWTFTFTGVSGVCRATPDGRFGSWHVKSIHQGDDDITNRLVDFSAPGSLRDAVVTLSDRETRLIFDVTGESGPTTDYVALVFPAEPSEWGESGTYTWAPAAIGDAAASGSAVRTAGKLAGTEPAAPGLSGATPDRLPKDGLTLVRADDYLVVAVDDVGRELAQTREFLEAIAPQATRVSLADGEQRIVRLRRQPAPAPAP